MKFPLGPTPCGPAGGTAQTPPGGADFEDPVLVKQVALDEACRKQQLGEIAAAMFEEDFADAILAFDAQAAVFYAERVAASEASGRPCSMGDAQIAAMVRCSSSRAADASYGVSRPAPSSKSSSSSRISEMRR